MKDVIALYILSIWFEPGIVKAGTVGFVIVVGTMLAAVLYRRQPGADL